MTKNTLILSWLEGIPIQTISDPVQTVQILGDNCLETHRALIRQEIWKLRALGVISPCAHRADQFVSSVFLVPKPNGSFRLILNLKKLNLFLPRMHFKMEDYRCVLRLLQQGDFMCTIDLKDAYYLLSVRSEDRRFLRFRFDSTLLQFNCLPFGLSSGPWFFTKLMKPVMTYLRSRGIRCVIYLDDLFILGSSQEECRTNTEFTRDLLNSLGFLINEAKSNFTPSQRAEYLGFLFDSTRMTIALPESKRVSLMEKIRVCRDSTSLTIRDLAKMTGSLVAASPATPYGLLYTKDLEREKFIALARSRNFESPFTLSDSCHSALAWWQSHLSPEGCPIRSDCFDLEIFSDSTLKGWGAWCRGSSAQGIWTREDLERHTSINQLELRAAFFGLKTFARGLSNCQILLRIDNTTAIAYVNRMGGIQLPSLSNLAKELWQWCERRAIFVVASYIPSKENVEADRASRIFKNLDTEWEFSQVRFEEVRDILGHPEIDLFASRANSKCELFFSWRPDPNALGVDAFTFDWSQFSLFYAFPPFSLILRVLKKILSDRATGILIFPFWPGNPGSRFCKVWLCLR